MDFSMLVAFSGAIPTKVSFRFFSSSGEKKKGSPMNCTGMVKSGSVTTSKWHLINLASYNGLLRAYP